MIVRIIMCLVLIGMGSFAFYTVFAKPDHPFSGELLDQAIGIRKDRYENDSRGSWITLCRPGNDRIVENNGDTSELTTPSGQDCS